MFKKTNWVWLAYFILYFFISCLNLFYFFASDSPMNSYYHIAMAFDFHFFGTYLFNFISLTLNVLTLLPLFLYIHRIDLLNNFFWRWFFVLRLAFDVVGHNYEMNFIKSIAYDNHALGIKTLLMSLFFTLPSYLALYEYAFGNPKSRK